MSAARAALDAAINHAEKVDQCLREELEFLNVKLQESLVRIDQANYLIAKLTRQLQEVRAAAAPKEKNVQATDNCFAQAVDQCSGPMPSAEQAEPSIKNPRKTTVHWVDELPRPTTDRLSHPATEPNTALRNPIQ